MCYECDEWDEYSDYMEEYWGDDDEEYYCDDCGALLVEFDGVWWCDHCSNDLGVLDHDDETQETPAVNQSDDPIPF